MHGRVHTLQYSAVDGRDGDLFHARWSFNLCTPYTFQATQRTFGRHLPTDRPRSRARLQDFGDQRLPVIAASISIYVYLEMNAAGLGALPSALRFDAPAPAARARPRTFQCHRAHRHSRRRAIERVPPSRTTEGCGDRKSTRLKSSPG